MATPDRYGPHDPSTMPADLAPILARQREQLNRLARGQPLTGLRSALCRVCSKPEHQCLTLRRGTDDPHEYELPTRVR